jgi:hypothetical protein
VVVVVVVGAALAVVGAVLDPVEARARVVPEGTATAQLRKVIQAGRIQIPGCLVIGPLPGVRGRRGLVQILAEPIRTRTGGLTRTIPMRKIRPIRIVQLDHVEGACAIVLSTGTQNQRN